MIYDVVIVASGKGERANLGYNKAFYRMKDSKTILEKSASLFIEDEDCKKIIVVTSQDCLDLVFKNDKVVTTIGGKLRKDSVYNGLLKVESEYVLIHDAARPFLTKESLEELKEKVVEKDAAIIGKLAIDTIKVIDGDKIVKTIDRKNVLQAETPQGFKTSLIKECYEKCLDVEFTDEASLLESQGHDVYVVIDKYNNRKLTTEEDFKNL